MVNRQLPHPLNSSLENVIASNSRMEMQPRFSRSASLGRKPTGSKNFSSKKQNTRHRRYGRQIFYFIKKCVYVYGLCVIGDTIGKIT